MTFPAESVPDGSVLLPHHLTIGVAAALLALALTWDDMSRSEPWAATTMLLGALFAFLFVWPHYGPTGAAITLVGLLAALVAFVASPFCGVGPGSDRVARRWWPC